MKDLPVNNLRRLVQYFLHILSSDRVLLRMPCLPHSGGSWILEPSCIIFLGFEMSVTSPGVTFFLWTILQMDRFHDFLTLSLQKCGCWSKGAGSEQSQVQQEMWDYLSKWQSSFMLGSNEHTKQSTVFEEYVWREERGRETGRTCLSDTGNSGTARPLQLSLLSMHMMHFSSKHKTCEKLQSNAGSCFVTCTSAGQLCLVHQSIGDGWRSWGPAVTEREMQTSPLEENEPETRCELLQWDCNAL